MIPPFDMTSTLVGLSGGETVRLKISGYQIPTFYFDSSNGTLTVERIGQIPIAPTSTPNKLFWTFSQHENYPHHGKLFRMAQVSLPRDSKGDCAISLKIRKDVAGETVISHKNFIKTDVFHRSYLTNVEGRGLKPQKLAT